MIQTDELEQTVAEKTHQLQSLLAEKTMALQKYVVHADKPQYSLECREEY